MFHNGPTPATGSDMLATHNPANPTERVGAYTPTDPAELARLVSQARAAQRDWSARTVSERLELMAKWLDAIASSTEEIARAITLEQGKPLAEARGETMKSLAEARQMLAIAAQPLGSVHATMRGGVTPLSVRRPRGLIAAITPWNFPVLTPMRKLVPALAFGNAIILKPSELAPAAACLVVQEAEGILPEGLVQIALGGAALGDALVRCGAEGVTFTGSVATGRAVFRAASETLAELSLELGGKNAALIHDVRDLDACLDQVAAAAYLCSGQRCTAISRVLVRADMVEDVTQGLVRRAEALVPGDGMHQGTTLGPLITSAHHDRVAGMVRDGLAQSGRLRTGGVALDGAGHLFAPTVIDNVAPTSSLAQDEIFGPVISVVSYSDIEEGFAILNDSAFGLSAALFSADAAIVERFMTEAAAGMLHVNHGTTPDSNMPFVGIRNSGVGAPSVGPGASSFYTTEHAVYLGHQ